MEEEKEQKSEKENQLDKTLNCGDSLQQFF